MESIFVDFFFYLFLTCFCIVSVSISDEEKINILHAFLAGLLLIAVGVIVSIVRGNPIEELLLFKFSGWYGRLIVLGMSLVTSVTIIKIYRASRGPRS